MEEKKGGLGRRALKCGIIGFLSSIVIVGLVFDFVALINGICALCQKDQAKGRAIAGLAFALGGFAIGITFIVKMCMGSL